MSLTMPLAVSELVAFSHLESTWLTVEMVDVRIGASRKTPAPTVPLPSKKEMPSSSCGRKPPTAVKARLGNVACNGRAVTLVLSLYVFRIRKLRQEAFDSLGGNAYKPVWLELDTLKLRKMDESFGIFNYSQHRSL